MPFPSAPLDDGDGRSGQPCMDAADGRSGGMDDAPVAERAALDEAKPSAGPSAAAVLGATAPVVEPAAPSPGTPSPHPFRYYVKGAKGDFGVVDMVQLQQLYHSGFLTRDNLVRRDGTDIYRKAGCIPELQVVDEKSWLEGNEVIVLAVLLCVATLLMILVLRW